MVAFTFAYSGIESFTQWVITFKALNVELGKIQSIIKFCTENSTLIEDKKTTYLEKYGNQ
jgi:hypothetical protein